MVPFIFAARENHGVTSPDDYLRKHAAFIGRLAKRGARFAVHDVLDRFAARVDANRWVMDCDCGNTCATDPEWALACCYACGAVYRQVVFPAPEDRKLFEVVLVARRNLMQRAWAPGETLADLVAENISIGAPVPDDIVKALPAPPLDEPPIKGEVKP